jgi:hypothetical protein
MKIIPFLMANGKYKLYERTTSNFISSNHYDKVIIGRETTYTVIKANKYGILNPQGELIIDCQYDKASGFDKNGLALVKINERYGFINMNNELIIQPVYEYLSDFYEGLASVKINGNRKFINTSGNFISQKEYEETSIFCDGRCQVKDNGKWGLIDKDENILIPFMYDSIMEENKICRVELNGEYFLIDLYNNQISEKYDYMDYQKDGSYKVSRNGLSGHIETNGSVLIPLIYENCTDFHGGYTGVYFDRNWFFIDRENNVVIEPNKYNLCEILNGIEDGIAVVSNDDGWGLLNLKIDKMHTDFIYDQSMGIKGGLCSFKKNSKWGFVDKDGIERIDYKYSDIGYFEDGIAHIYSKGQMFEPKRIEFYIDDQGKEFREI